MLDKVKVTGKDWIVTAKETFGVDLTPVQLDIMEAIQRTGSRVSAIETDGMGRSRLYALICATAVLFQPELKIIFVTTEKSRLNNTLGELHSLFYNAVRPLGFHYSISPLLMPALIRHVRDKVDFRYVRKGSEEALAGDFNHHSLYIVDNAALISDVAFKVLTGGMTEEDNRMLLVSEAYRNEGYFYETHHAYKDAFHAVRSNSEESPLVDEHWLRVAAADYSDEEYRRRVLGEFPQI
ncbi:hypothetical protein K9O81_18780 [Leclercia adecarboxylata]|uniref:hypothetical protein n=1 Tax=Leclercia adecarboxylata TaxID=83655 RepID=UPI001CBE3236|nr:hypothetical protein [Leclercia adecarboxylata]MBZ3802416.1 hypothetical protein [Leclercia adecarboxylata]MBZ3807052.1 hypothetical protein [Leclercia adecarboxylata]